MRNFIQVFIGLILSVSLSGCQDHADFVQEDMLLECMNENYSQSEITIEETVGDVEDELIDYGFWPDEQSVDFSDLLTAEMDDRLRNDLLSILSNHLTYMVAGVLSDSAELKNCAENISDDPGNSRYLKRVKALSNGTQTLDGLQDLLREDLLGLSEKQLEHPLYRIVIMTYFWLNTPMNEVRQVLPKKMEIPERRLLAQPPDVLRISTNAQNEIYLRENRISREDLDVLASMVREFYVRNKHNHQTGGDSSKVQCLSCNPEFPFYIKMDKPYLKAKISLYQGLIADSSLEAYSEFYRSMIKQWEKRLDMLRFLGVDFYLELIQSAAIELDMDPNTDYGLYLELRAVIKGVIDQLRAEQAELLFDVSYEEILDHLEKTGDAGKADPDILKMKQALDILVPDRIVEASFVK